MFDIDENTMVITTVDIINKKKKVVLVFWTERTLVKKVLL